MSVKSVPERLSTTFNTNYYFQDGDYLLNNGNQKLRGKLQLDGQTNYGNDLTYGDSTFKDEPIIMTITDPSQLQANHLVSKSYVDSRVSGNYPQVFTYGKAYKGTPLTTTVDGYVLINFLDPTPVMQSLYIEVVYDIQLSNDDLPVVRSTAMQRTAVYNVTFYKDGIFNRSEIELIDGDSLTDGGIRTLIGGPSYQPFGVGTSNGLCVIRYQFPPSNTVATTTNNDNWLASCGITLRILHSTPQTTNEVDILSASNTGSAYFSIP